MFFGKRLEEEMSMLKCPNCMEPIPKEISTNGGNCPRCAELILPLGNDFAFEISDTEERDLVTEEVENTELHILDFDDEELEATELIHRRPLRAQRGSLFDREYQEDFPDQDFFPEEGVSSRRLSPAKKNRSIAIILILVAVIGILSGVVYQTYQKKSVVLDSVVYEDVPSFRQDRIPVAQPEPEEEVVETKTKTKTKVVRKKEPLDPAIENLLELRLKSFRSCVDRAKMKKKSLTASIRYRLVIQESGQVTNTKITVKGDRLDSFERCLNKQISRWKFPKIEKTVKISRSFQVGG